MKSPVIALENVRKSFTLHLQDGVVIPVFEAASLAVGRGECVDPRLRERVRERCVLVHVDPGRAVRPGLRGERGRIWAEDDAGRLAERRRLREDAEPALLELAVGVLEVDEEIQSSRLSST